ncbi:MAG: UDP binding domain-containing protein [Campylobacterota bacterium]|nr:UDP binding domain-containing protein [Campylobacterota bacterium]
MDNFKDLILETKKVSIWGIGYLGYTTILRLQDNGFYSTLYDFNIKRLEKLIQGNYPDKEQLNSWSKNGKIPSINLKYIEIIKDNSLLFNNKIHIVSFPNVGNFNYLELANIFIENKDKLEDSLIIFQSAGIPKSIEKEFCKILEDNNIYIEVSTVFRSDWTVESFFNKDINRRISGNNNYAIVKTEAFLNLLGLNILKLSNIEEAEVYENTKNALNYTMVAFFNQLSLSYPHININELSNKLLEDMDFNNFSLGVSSVDYKSEQSIENILRGSSVDFLSIIKEANNTNISFLFYYINLLKNKNINSVSILGLSSYNSIKDLRFSPSIILAEYLNKENIKVCVFDNNFTEEELVEILPYCEFKDINSHLINSDVVFIMSLPNEYKFFTQKRIDEIGLSNVKYLLDNTGFFKNFVYSEDTVYHQLCDENLIKVLN